MLQDFPMYAYIPAKDLARARQFYETKLGFKPREETAGGVVYAFGQGTACFLYPTPNQVRALLGAWQFMTLPAFWPAAKSGYAGVSRRR